MHKVKYVKSGHRYERCVCGRIKRNGTSLSYDDDDCCVYLESAVC
jgi:hypothetical protein